MEIIDIDSYQFKKGKYIPGWTEKSRFGFELKPKFELCTNKNLMYLEEDLFLNIHDNIFVDKKMNMVLIHKKKVNWDVWDYLPLWEYLLNNPEDLKFMTHLEYIGSFRKEELKSFNNWYGDYNDEFSFNKEGVGDLFINEHGKIIIIPIKKEKERSYIKNVKTKIPKSRCSKSKKAVNIEIYPDCGSYISFVKP
jgi:hypothetical protein